MSLTTRFGHDVNLGSMERRMRALTKDFQWDRMDNVFLKANDEPACA